MRGRDKQEHTELRREAGLKTASDKKKKTGRMRGVASRPDRVRTAHRVKTIRHAKRLFSVKIYKTRSETVVAAADVEILGNEYSSGELKLQVSRAFYEGDTLGEEAMIARLKIGTIINIVGVNCINAAIRNGIIAENSVIVIDGIPHAQIFCIS